MPDDGRIIACDVSEEWTSIARRYWREAGVEKKIDLRLKPALATLDDLIATGQGGQFDFAFIDADKQNYANYFERALVLVRPGGLIAVDNVLWYGKVIDPAVIDVDWTVNGQLYVNAGEVFSFADHGFGNGSYKVTARAYDPTDWVRGDRSDLEESVTWTVLVNDDSPPGFVFVNDVTTSEGNNGTKVATFTVGRTGGTAAFDINYGTVDSSASLVIR